MPIRTISISSDSSSSAAFGKNKSTKTTTSGNPRRLGRSTTTRQSSSPTSNIIPKEDSHSLPWTTQGVLVPIFDSSSLEGGNINSSTMFPAPFFIAPFQPMMPPDFVHPQYEGPFTPDMYTIYPNMQLLVPIPAAEGVPANVSPPAPVPSPTPMGQQANGSNQETSVQGLPYEPPQFGPGPPIITGDRLKGPRGCNLFVFHLPNEITNWDLYLLFRRHGTILSVHIMVNKATGLSKGYGFVSYAYKHDAQVAIEAMDGFRLGKKRLKVQLKRLQDDNMDGGWEEEATDADAFLRTQAYSPRGSSTGNTPNSDIKRASVEAGSKKV